jgi:hypothetical protein
MRAKEVANLAGVPVSCVEKAAAQEVRDAYADRAASVVVEVATQEPALYWRVGNRYYLDDPYFGDVVAIDDLDYNSEIGLHVRGISPKSFWPDSGERKAAMGPLLNCLTINTGHVLKIPRSEVPDETQIILREWIFKGLNANNRTIPLPLPYKNYAAAVVSKQGGLMVSVYGLLNAQPSMGEDGNWLPIVTFGVAENWEQSDSLWCGLEACSLLWDLPWSLAPSGPAIHPPEPPWCSVALWPTCDYFPDAAKWIVDFERCVAWAWLTRTQHNQH